MSTTDTRVIQYDHPAQFEPLLPNGGMDDLAAQARPVVEDSLRLQACVHPHTLGQVRRLVRSMNSYYSNRIEGQSTHPLHIEQALHAQFSGQPDIAFKQRLAVAHIHAEQALEAAQVSETQALSSATLCMAHRLLYQILPEADRLTDAGAPLAPGKLRQQDVAVYRHQPPTWASVPQFLDRADAVYARAWWLEQLLVVAACAHHRLTWVHPFLDGNGRACRLQTHLALAQLSGGLWSVNRGLARQRDAYYQRLSEADMPRHGDLDGRGNLSDKMLRAWCAFFIDICQDQVSFMRQILALDTLNQRMATLIQVRAASLPDYRLQAIAPLQHVLVTGPLARGAFVQLSGLGERTGRKLLALLLQDGLLQSDTPKGPVGIGLPLDALHILLPNLYPEAAAALPAA
ncbi:MAG: Fic family protein [Rhodoferax sp.]|nr:Fic family protein [Rhodoferax sp.]